MQQRYPIDYILTIHRSNYELTYGRGSFDMTVTATHVICPIVNNLFNTYGKNKVKSFVTEVVNVKAGFASSFR